MAEAHLYRNQSVDLQRKSEDCFLYDRDLRHERVKVLFLWKICEKFVKKL